jgi:hypothetical protein
MGLDDFSPTRRVPEFRILRESSAFSAPRR